MSRSPDLQSADRKTEMSAYEHHAARIPTTSARQGITLGRVRYVLGIGLAMVIVAFAIIYFLHFR
jgi:hypothetical protein